MDVARADKEDVESWPAIDPERTLQTARLLLEPLVAFHAATLYPALQDPELYTYISQDPPSSPHSLAERYTMLATRRSPDGQEIWLNWVLHRRDTGAYVGVVEASVYADRTATLAYMVFPPFWRQGYAREGCARVLAHLFDDYKVSRVAAEIDTRNAASIRLVESLGFRRVAVLSNADFFKGAPSDEFRYELIAYEPAFHGPC
jgi:RimJ/RimL family protein N-acetyltransferase